VGQDVRRDGGQHLTTLQPVHRRDETLLAAHLECSPGALTLPPTVKWGKLG
jgi:hypothetical protein